MRLRACILVASVLGAGGALLLAADLYRRVQAAESAAIAGSRATGGLSAFFGMVHVLGVAALAFLFLTIFLLISLSKNEAAAIPSAAAVASPAAPQGEPAVPQEAEVVPDDESAPAPKAEDPGATC